MTVALDLTGQQFGRLTAISRGSDWTSPKSGARKVRWTCRCSCGQEVLVLAASLRSGAARSCGCLRRDRPATHRMYGTPTYISWAAMIARCTRSNHPAWPRYGGRGITVCQRWRDSFAHFFADMGERPTDRSLDRVNNDGNYEPGNCRWATRKEQRHNRSDSRTNR